VESPTPPSIDIKRRGAYHQNREIPPFPLETQQFANTPRCTPARHRDDARVKSRLGRANLTRSATRAVGCLPVLAWVLGVLPVILRLGSLVVINRGSVGAIDRGPCKRRVETLARDVYRWRPAPTGRHRAGSLADPAAATGDQVIAGHRRSAIVAAQNVAERDRGAVDVGRVDDPALVG
jgi:hypothetical protein